jgi:hypothetical protein
MDGVCEAEKEAGSGENGEELGEELGDAVSADQGEKDSSEQQLLAEVQALLAQQGHHRYIHATTSTAAATDSTTSAVAHRATYSAWRRARVSIAISKLKGGGRRKGS